MSNMFDDFFGMNPTEELDKIYEDSLVEKKPDINVSGQFDRGEDLLVKAYRDAVIAELYGE